MVAVARRMEKNGFRVEGHWKIKGFVYTVAGRKP